MKKLISIILLSFMLGGCSFLPRLTFNRTTSTLPMATDKSYIKESCKGQYRTDEQGLMTFCSEGYYRNENIFNQTERNFTAWEKIQNIFNNLLGWGIPILILVIIFVPGVLGWILHRFTSSSVKGFKMLVEGIQDGKNYVRHNGTNFTEEQRKIYIKGSDDMLTKISESVTDSKVKEEIAKIRAKL